MEIYRSEGKRLDPVAVESSLLYMYSYRITEFHYVCSFIQFQRKPSLKTLRSTP